MTMTEEINLVAMAHDCHGSEPALISPLATPVDLAFPGIAVVGPSIDAFTAEPPGAPTGALVCYSTDNVSALLARLIEEGRRQHRQTVVMAIRADNDEVRQSLGEDLAARVHMDLRS